MSLTPSRCVQFPLADYFTDWEIEERKNRAMKDYCNFLKHNADARRAHHGGKGVAARRRTNGVVSYEARISKHVVGVSTPCTWHVESQLAQICLRQNA